LKRTCASTGCAMAACEGKHKYLFSVSLLRSCKRHLSLQPPYYAPAVE
jgi:hypothetical protein